MMTKKDYVRAAEIVRAAKDEHKNPIAAAFGVLFEGDNPRFDKERFLTAALGIDSKKTAKKMVAKG